MNETKCNFKVVIHCSPKLGFVNWPPEVTSNPKLYFVKHAQVYPNI